MRLAATHPTWALGFEDEVWWSRLAQPALHGWAEAHQPLQRVEQAVAKDDPDPKALACYGLLVRAGAPDGRRREAAWLRFVAGRPVSAPPIEFLAWCCGKLADPTGWSSSSAGPVWTMRRPLASRRAWRRQPASSRGQRTTAAIIY